MTSWCKQAKKGKLILMVLLFYTNYMHKGLICRTGKQSMHQIGSSTILSAAISLPSLFPLPIPSWRWKNIYKSKLPRSCALFLLFWLYNKHQTPACPGAAMSFTMPAASPTWPLLPSGLWTWDCSLVPKHGTTCSPVPTGTQVTAQSRTAHQRFSQPKESSEDRFTPPLSTPPTSLQPAGAMRGCDRKSVLITVSLFIPHFSSAINSCRELAPRFHTSSRYDTGFSSSVFKLQLLKQKSIYEAGEESEEIRGSRPSLPLDRFSEAPPQQLAKPSRKPQGIH